jgi:hypothetical protein
MWLNVLERLESRLHIGQPLRLSDQHLISVARNLNDTTIGWIAFSTGSRIGCNSKGISPG